LELFLTIFEFQNVLESAQQMKEFLDEEKGCIIS
jgi:hypothetical protein